MFVRDGAVGRGCADGLLLDTMKYMPPGARLPGTNALPHGMLLCWMKMSESDFSLLPVGQPAPRFARPSVQGPVVELAAYRERRSVLLWFSRGFQCAFCRHHMHKFATHIDTLLVHNVELIQITSNLLASARLYLRDEPPPFPYVLESPKLIPREPVGLTMKKVRNCIVSLEER